MTSVLKQRHFKFSTHLNGMAYIDLFLYGRYNFDHQGIRHGLEKDFKLCSGIEGPERNVYYYGKPIYNKNISSSEKEEIQESGFYMGDLRLYRIKGISPKSLECVEERVAYYPVVKLILHEEKVKDVVKKKGVYDRVIAYFRRKLPCRGSRSG